MKNKQLFLDFLRVNVNISTINTIASNLNFVIKKFNVSEKDFYLFSNKQHVKNYYQMKLDLGKSSLSSPQIFCYQYAYRNYLEFLGCNPEPLRRNLTPSRKKGESTITTGEEIQVIKSDNQFVKCKIEKDSSGKITIELY